MDSKDKKDSACKGEEFVQRLMANRKRIYVFILTLVGNSNDANDIMQETASVMWEKYMESDTISNFAAWGIRIAHYKILEFRKKYYNEKILFNNDLFESVLGGAMSVEEDVDNRYDALKKCISKLRPEQRKIIELRHQKDQTVKDIANEMKLTEYNVYKIIPRVHDILVRCVRIAMNAEER